MAAKKNPSRESRDFTSTSGNSVVLPGTKRSEKLSPPCERNIDGKKLYISNPIY